MSVIPPLPAVEKVAKRVITEAVAVATVVAAVLSVLAAVLPQLHVPAADTAIIASASAFVTAFLSWARARGITAKVARSIKGA